MTDIEALIPAILMNAEYIVKASFVPLIYVLIYIYMRYRTVKVASSIAETKGIDDLLYKARTRLIHNFALEIGETYRSAIAEYFRNNPLEAYREAQMLSRQKSDVPEESSQQRKVSFLEFYGYLMSVIQGLLITKEEIGKLLKEGKIKLDEELLYGANKYKVRLSLVDEIREGLKYIEASKTIFLVIMMLSLILIVGVSPMAYKWVESHVVTEDVIGIIMTLNAYILLAIFAIEYLVYRGAEKVMKISRDSVKLALKASSHIIKLKLKIGKDEEKNIEEVLKYVEEEIEKT